MIKKDGIAISDFTVDETGRFPVDPEVYYAEQLKQKRALESLEAAIENIVVCCDESEEFHNDLAEKKWFGKDMMEILWELREVLNPES